MAIIVGDEFVQKNEEYGRTINQIVEFFISPVLKEKKRSEFHAAYVELFDDGRPNRVLLDGEVKFVAVLSPELQKKLKKIKKISGFQLSQITDITFSPTIATPNAAKILLIKWNKDLWVLNFDFRYNLDNLKRCLSLIPEYLASAQSAYQKQHFNSAIFNLWAGTELLVDAKYCQEYRKMAAPKSRHYERLDKVSTLPIFTDDFKSLFVFLSKNYQIARYPGTAKIDFSTAPFPEKDFFENAIRLLNEEFKKLLIMNNIYLEFEAYLEKLKSELKHAYSSFGLIDQLAILRAPNKVSRKQALENLRKINKNKAVFLPAQWNTYFHLVVTLAKFFDDNNPEGKITLWTMSNFVRNNRHKFNTKAFQEAYPERAALIKSVRIPSGQVPKQIRSRKKKLQPFINKIISLRNQLCHNMLDAQDIPTKYGEYVRLLSLIEAWISYFDHILLKSVSDYKWYDKTSRE
ncbi:hypothetical protein IT412_01965, partial [Candidatus Peregrinibacteria bacterium]|nr:hypothetical protein [Candidatus Peregrinibacteria bacterium]